ncbi:uncharacterized protein LOC131857772 [Cryptomeria japonica]|uniref:uncharacterized protein LOC131857772 n=1 Tax=Cryptomeria japonica TaxID=3369 RepID=UPI0027DA39DD|nr:uncharacterized protein LOC131857772 [Cryptomeria japonica]
MSFNWTKEGKRIFEEIKEALASTPTLLNLDFSKEFVLYAYGNIDSIAAMLVQQNSDGMEQPIAFFSQGLKDYELKYTFVEKHVLAIIRSFEKNRHMLSNNKVTLLVAHHVVIDFLLSKDLGEKRAGWITKVMEYDIEVKVTKLIRGKDLCEHMAGHSSEGEGSKKEEFLVIQDEVQTTVPIEENSWMQEIIHILLNGEYPQRMDKAKRRYFRLYSIPYVLVDGILFRKDHNGILLRCIDNDQTVKVLHEFHDGPIGAINPPSSAGHMWVLIATDYFTRWTEAVALNEANEGVVLNFYDELITRFGVLDSIISDNSLAFVGLK